MRRRRWAGNGGSVKTLMEILNGAASQADRCVATRAILFSICLMTYVRDATLVSVPNSYKNDGEKFFAFHVRDRTIVKLQKESLRKSCFRKLVLNNFCKEK